MSDFASRLKVAVVLGSDSDRAAMSGAFDTLREIGIPFEARILSAHRTPDELASFASNARDNGFGVIVAAAGKAAHLAGAIASRTTLPVIGVPMRGSELDGLDALLSTVQMPSGVPVATVAIGGATNAAILSAQILAITDIVIAKKLEEIRLKTKYTTLLNDTKLSCETKQ